MELRSKCVRDAHKAMLLLFASGMFRMVHIKWPDHLSAYFRKDGQQLFPYRFRDGLPVRTKPLCGGIRETSLGVSIRVRINTRFVSKSGDYTSRRFVAETRPYQSPESFTVRFWLRKST